MKISVAQTLVTRDIAANGAAIRRILVASAAVGARLVHFCEGSLSGYAKAQIERPENFESFDWIEQEQQLRSIAALCAELRIFAVIGGAHRLGGHARPHNSLYVLSDSGELLTRYDKRLLSHSEVSSWYTPGTEPIIVEVDGYRYGLAICIEVQFHEVFAEYERLGADAILFASYGIPDTFQLALRAHAGLTSLWIAGATPAQKAPQGPAGIIGPDGKVIVCCPAMPNETFVTATLDRAEPKYEIALTQARPWRASARLGEIYRATKVDDPRSGDRTAY